MVPQPAPDGRRRPAGRLRGDAQLALLAQAGAELLGALEPSAVLSIAVQLAVPTLGDLCMVDLLKPGGYEAAAVASVPPEAALRLEEIRLEAPLDPAGPHPVAEAGRSGQPLWVPEFDDRALELIAASPEHLQFMRESGYRCSYLVPLRDAEGKVFAVFSALRFVDRLPFGPQERELAGQLAQRTAQAYQNATLYAQANELRTLFEAAFDGASVGLTILDREGRRLYANPAAARLAGYDDPRALCGQPASWVAGEPPPATDLAGNELAPEQFPPLAALAGGGASEALVGCNGGLLVRARPLSIGQLRFVLCELAAAPRARAQLAI